MAENGDYSDDEDGDTVLEVETWSDEILPYIFKGRSSGAACVTQVSKSSIRFHLNT